MVDFDTNAMLLKEAGIRVIAGSVDTVEDTASLHEGLRLRYIEMIGELDAVAVADATGAFYQDGDRVFLHATGFLLDPAGLVNNAVYSTGPIGRFGANDVLKKVAFERFMRVRAAGES